jgi:putative acetyltransferase
MLAYVKPRINGSCTGCDPPYRPDVLIRTELPGDHAAVSDLHRLAFGAHGCVVAALADELRASLDSEQGLSLVACDGEQVIGHVLFSRNLLDAPPRLVDVQVLSPVGVLPDRQRQGVGSALVRHGLEVLSEWGVPLVFLEGSPTYYGRLGFSSGQTYGFRRPSLRIPQEAFQVRLLPAYELWMTGTLVYRHTFWAHDSVGLRSAPPR